MKTLYNMSEVRPVCRQSRTQKSLKFLTFFFFSYLLFINLCCAQQYSDEDVTICESKFQLALNEDLQSKPIGKVIVEIGKSFIGTDYAAHTLEKEGDEQLVIKLTGLDCTTFLENALVFAECIKKGKTSFEDYQKELTLIRYRNGRIAQYPSRLHYFTDWIYDNEKKGIVKDITKDLGGESLKLDLSFMSDHPQFYMQLEKNPDFIPVIRKQEEEINKRTHYFIPQEKIREAENGIEDGDLLAFTSNVKGLDVNHVGIAIRMDDRRIHILHAPDVGYKVQISELPLAEYVEKIEKDDGVILVRVLEPNASE